MGGIKVRYLEARRLADGSTAYYYCPPRKATSAGIVAPEALGKAPAEAATRAEYLNNRVDDWRAGRDVAPHDKAVGSIDWLIKEYEASEKFKKLSRSTQIDYSARLKVFANLVSSDGRRLGTFMARNIKPRHADKFYLKLQEPDEDGNPTKLQGANGIVRVVRRMFSLAVRWEATESNPFAKMGLTKGVEREIVVPPEHVDIFCRQAEAMGRRSMSVLIRLTYEFCQRLVDMRLFPWNRYSGHEVQVRQSKTRRLVWVPLLPDLADIKRILDETPRISTVVIINEETGKPYTKYEVSRVFNEIRDAAGLPKEYRAGDMRRSGLDEAGDAGATDDELRSLSGHASREVVAHYVKPNRTKAASAVRKRQQHRRNGQKHLDSGS